MLRQLNELVELLHQSGIMVALETQGSIWQEWFLQIDELTLSPKPPSSGMTTDWEQLDVIVDRLAEHRRDFSLKVVVFDETDLQYAIAVHERYKQFPFYLQAGNDDVLEQDSAALLDRLIERYKWLVDTVIASAALTNVRVLPQLHAWLWGNKRGK